MRDFYRVIFTDLGVISFGVTMILWWVMVFCLLVEAWDVTLTPLQYMAAAIVIALAYPFHIAIGVLVAYLIASSFFGD